MKRIILHWSAGGYTPNKTDFEHYHFLVDNMGRIYKGKYAPEDNLNCSDKRYAAHTGGGNTGSIGIAALGMYGLSDKKTLYPLTKVQMEALYKLAAELCIKYSIKASPETLMSHYEFGLKNQNTTSKGKIDISFLPFEAALRANEIGNFMRSKIRWYIRRKTE